MKVWVEIYSISGVHRGSLKSSANKQKQNQKSVQNMGNTNLISIACIMREKEMVVAGGGGSEEGVVTDGGSVHLCLDARRG